MIPTLINSPDAEVSAAVSVEADALSDVLSYVLSVSVDAVDEAGAEPDPHAVNPITIAAAIAKAISFLFICYNLPLMKNSLIKD